MVRYIFLYINYFHGNELCQQIYNLKSILAGILILKPTSPLLIDLI